MVVALVIRGAVAEAAAQTRLSRGQVQIPQKMVVVMLHPQMYVLVLQVVVVPVHARPYRQRRMTSKGQTAAPGVRT